MIQLQKVKDYLLPKYTQMDLGKWEGKVSFQTGPESVDVNHIEADVATEPLSYSQTADYTEW